jgi:diadenosine tetraphosphate (Ap4A) HIT family hydrolase
MCPFCEIEKNSILLENEGGIVILDQYPVSEGHLLILPKQHILDWFSAPSNVQMHLIELLNRSKEWLTENYSPQGFNVGMNCGEVAGQTVMHLHIHLIPRYLHDTPNPAGGVRGVIPGKQGYQLNEAAVCTGCQTKDC